MSGARPDPIAALLGALSERGIDLAARDVLDAWWLSRVMAPEVREAPEVAEEPEEEEEEDEPEEETEDVEEPPASSAPSAAPQPAPVRLAPMPEVASVPVEIPSPSVLPERGAVLRSLRPLLRRLPSHRRKVVDAERTAQRCAEEGRMRRAVPRSSRRAAGRHGSGGPG